MLFSVLFLFLFLKATRSSSVLVRGVSYHAAASARTSTHYNPFALGAFATGIALTAGAVVSAETIDYDQIRKEVAALLEAKEEDHDDGNFGPLLVR